MNNEREARSYEMIIYSVPTGLIKSSFSQLRCSTRFN